MLKNRLLHCKIWYFHSSVAKDSSLVGRDAVLTRGNGHNAFSFKIKQSKKNSHVAKKKCMLYKHGRATDGQWGQCQNYPQQCQELPTAVSGTTHSSVRNYPQQCQELPTAVSGTTHSSVRNYPQQCQELLTAVSGTTHPLKMGHFPEDLNLQIVLWSTVCYTFH